MTTFENNLIDYEVTEEGVFYEDDASSSGEESDPLASSADDAPDREAREEVFGASLEDLIAEARGARGRRKRRRGAPSAVTKRSKTDVPAHLMPLMGAATISYMMKRFDEAEAALQNILREAPRAGAPYRTLGLIYEEKGDMSKALDTYMKAAEINKSDRDLWKRNAALWEEAGNSEQAIYCLTMALRGTHGKDADALRARGQLFLNDRKFRKAADSFNKLAKLAPDDVSVAHLIVQTYRQLNEDGRAVPLLEGMLQSVEQNAPRASNVEAVAAHEGKVSELIQMLVELRFRQKRYHDASFLLTRLQGRSSTSGRPMTFVQRLMLAVCQHRLGSETLASPTFLEFLSSPSMSSKHKFLLRQVADACRDSGDYRKGVRAYTLLLEQDPNSPRAEFYLHRAVCHKELGNLSAAKTDLETVLQIQPRHVEASLRILEFLPPKKVSGGSSRRKARKDGTRGRRYVELDEDGQPVARANSLVATERVEMLCILRRANALFDRGDYKGYLALIYPALEAALQLGGPSQATDEQTVDMIKSRGAGEGDADDNDEDLSDGGSRTVKEGGKEQGEIASAGDKAPETWAVQNVSEAEQAKLYTVGASLMRFLDDESFVEVAERVTICFHEQGQLARAHPITKLFESLRHLRIKANPALKSRLKTLDMATAFAAGDVPRGYEHARTMLLEAPSDPDLCYAYCVADQQMGRGSAAQRVKSFRFLGRLIKKYPMSLFLSVVAGNCSSRGGINTSTYSTGIYLRAFSLAPHNPLICLCIAVQLLYVSLSRRVGNRNEMVLHALSFLDDYRRNRRDRAREEEKKWFEMEAEYNIGRAMHQLGLVHMATDMYRRVLQYEGDDGGEIPLWADLRRDAAYNLVLIYRASGSERLAASIVAKYLVF